MTTMRITLTILTLATTLLFSGCLAISVETKQGSIAFDGKKALGIKVP